MKSLPKKYHHGDLKSALVTAGLEILEEDGLDRLSLRAIAARVGVSHTAPKNHFDGLTGLLAAIATEGFNRHADEMRRNVAAHSPGRARLDAAAAGYVRFAEDNPALFRLMFSPDLSHSLSEDLHSAAARSYGVLEDVARGLIWTHKAPDGPGHVEKLRTEMMLWTYVHGYAWLLIEGRMPRQPDGSPILGVLDTMPAFDYAPMPEPEPKQTES